MKVRVLEGFYSTFLHVILMMHDSLILPPPPPALQGGFILQHLFAGLDIGNVHANVALFRARSLESLMEEQNWFLSRESCQNPVLWKAAECQVAEIQTFKNINHNKNKCILVFSPNNHHSWIQ
jgi:hypothetical protein